MKLYKLKMLLVQECANSDGDKVQVVPLCATSTTDQLVQLPLSHRTLEKKRMEISHDIWKKLFKRTKTKKYELKNLKFQKKKSKTSIWRYFNENIMSGFGRFLGNYIKKYILDNTPYLDIT